jgi:hypothetical protein
MNKNQQAATEGDLIEAAMAVLDQPLPEHCQSDFPPSISPTLARLAADRRPKAKTACEACPNSVWFTSPNEVKCYCRVMFLVTWCNKEPNQITACDGMLLGQGQ